MSNLDQAFIKAYDDSQPQQAGSASYVQLAGTRIAAKAVRALTARDRELERQRADEQLLQAEQPTAEGCLKMACSSTSATEAEPCQLNEKVLQPAQTTEPVAADAMIFTSTIAIDPESVIDDQSRSESKVSAVEPASLEEAACDEQGDVPDEIELLDDSDIIQQTLQIRLEKMLQMDEVVLGGAEEKPESSAAEANIEAAIVEENGPPKLEIELHSRVESFSIDHYRETEEAANNKEEKSSGELLSMHPLSRFLDEENQGSAEPVTVNEHNLSVKLEVEHFLWPTAVVALNEKANRALDDVSFNVEKCAHVGQSVLGWMGSQEQVGTTTLLLALAKQMAARSGSVLVIDTVLDQFNLSASLGVSPQLGWEDVLCEKHRLAEVLIQSKKDGLTVLPMRGDLPSIEALSAARLAEQINAHFYELRKQFSTVLIDLGNRQLNNHLAIVSKVSQILLDGVVMICNDSSDIGELPQNLVGVIENFHSESVAKRKVG